MPEARLERTRESYGESHTHIEQMPLCICEAVARDSDLIPPGQGSVTCPMHPGRTFFRGPSGMFS